MWLVHRHAAMVVEGMRLQRLMMVAVVADPMVVTVVVVQQATIITLGRIESMGRMSTSLVIYFLVEAEMLKWKLINIIF